MNYPTCISLPGCVLTGKFAIGACVTLLACAHVHAQTWSQTAGGLYDWNDNANWSATFPNAIGATADISADFAGDQTISLNAATTVGSLTIGDTGGSPDSAVTIDTGTSGSLTFQTSSGSATLTTTSVGTPKDSPVINTISAPITFTSATTINPGSLGSSNLGSGLTLSGPISGSGNITVTGSASGSSRSALTLSGDNSSYTGNWILSGSSGSTADSGAGITISNDNNLGAVPGTATTNITVTSGDNSVIRFNGTVNVNANRKIVVESGATLTLIQTNINTSTINGVISGAGGVAINGSSVNRKIKLSGANTYTGSTAIGQGTLIAGSTTALGLNSAVSLANSSQSKLDLANFSISIGSLSGGGSNGGEVILGSGTLTSGGLNTDSSFAGFISGTGGFTKIGTGRQTFSTRSSSYTGATTINDGTLAIGAANLISDSSALVLGGGTFATGGFNETLNTLTVNSNSFLDFGAGTSALTFADSSAITWAGTLTLLNFDIGTDSLKFGSSISALSMTQLESISLAGYTASLDAGGFVTFASTIPEPSTYAALAGACVLLAGVSRRRSRR